MSSANNYKNQSLGQSFKNAFNGVRLAFLSERNFRIHMCATVLVIIAGIILNIDLVRWALLTLAIGLVLASELVNTSIERLSDMVMEEYSEKVRIVKDLGAGAVLVSAIISAVTGVLVFLGPILDFISGWIK
ncbi:MAG: diacylglycerol kinase family protein [Clostridiaceae bacterium]|nr:diacylglycerol kinase family protein [Clostridiaceae bacterium]